MNLLNLVGIYQTQWGSTLSIHHFFLEVWESLYRHFVTIFVKDKTRPDFLACTSKWVKSLPLSPTQKSTLRNLKEMLVDISDKHRDYQKHFTKYITDHAERNDTWKFWAQFVFQDCFAYISLYLSMRSGKWTLKEWLPSSQWLHCLQLLTGLNIRSL